MNDFTNLILVLNGAAAAIVSAAYIESLNLSRLSRFFNRKNATALVLATVTSASAVSSAIAKDDPTNKSHKRHHIKIGLVAPKDTRETQPNVPVVQPTPYEGLDESALGLDFAY